MAGKKIALVVSEPQSAQLITLTLKNEGHQVMTAEDGPRGLKTIRKEQPDLVIVDFELQNMEGEEFCKRLRSDSATDHIRIIMIADEKRLDDLTIGPGASADDYLIRPFSPADLMTKTMPLLASRDASIVISTGNVELDNKMGGGVPLGSLTLIEGDSGAGKSVLSQQMIHGSLEDGFKVTVFTSENTVKSLTRQMRSLSLEILDYLLLDRLRVYPIEPSRLGKEAPPKLMEAVKKERRRDVIFVDSLTSSIPHSSDKEVLAFFEECKRACSEDTSVMIVVHSHGLSKEVLTRIRSLCDAHLQLHTEQVAQRLIKTLEVTKVRGADKTTGNIISFEVEPGWGMRIIPISKVRI